MSPFARSLLRPSLRLHCPARRISRQRSGVQLFSSHRQAQESAETSLPQRNLPHLLILENLTLFHLPHYTLFRSHGAIDSTMFMFVGLPL